MRTARGGGGRSAALGGGGGHSLAQLGIGAGGSPQGPLSPGGSPLADQGGADEELSIWELLQLLLIEQQKQDGSGDTGAIHAGSTPGPGIPPNSTVHGTGGLGGAGPGGGGAPPGGRIIHGAGLGIDQLPAPVNGGDKGQAYGFQRQPDESELRAMLAAMIQQRHPLTIGGGIRRSLLRPGRASLGARLPGGAYIHGMAKPAGTSTQTGSVQHKL